VQLKDGKLAADLAELALYQGNGKGKVTVDGAGKVSVARVTALLGGVGAGGVVLRLIAPDGTAHPIATDAESPAADAKADRSPVAAAKAALPGTVAADRAPAASTAGTQMSMSFTAAAEPAFEGNWRDLLGRDVAFVLAHGEDGPRLALRTEAARALVIGAEEIATVVPALCEGGSSLNGNDVKALCRLYGATPSARTLDVGVASYLYDPSIGEHGSGAVVERFLGEPAVPATVEHLGAALDQVARLIPILRDALAEHAQTELYESVELPLIGVLADIERRGILLDTDLLGRISGELDARMSALVARIYEAAGSEFNILSPLQLRDVLFTRLALPTRGVKITKTGPSTDSDTLEALAPLHPLPALVLEYRGLAKLKSTYVDSLPRLVDAQGRIHTTLNQTVAATGRLSSSDPNLQNIPIRTEDGARIRQAFVAAPGNVLISADYNQIELRVLAHLSQDAALSDAFRQGHDIHAATAAEVFGVPLGEVTPGMRRASKVINYGIVYGMGAVRLARELGISRQEAVQYIDRYFSRYAGVRRFYEEMLEHARRHGYVATLHGRRRYLPDIHSDHGGRRQFAERIATNTPIQGSAADIIKIAMVRLAAALRMEGLEAAMILQIHDELLVECREGELNPALMMIRDAMEGAADLAVPVVVDIGTGASWAEAH
jgi:DNA polymerase-1